MKHRIYLIGVLLLILLAACQTSTVETTATPTVVDEGGLKPRSTATPQEPSEENPAALATEESTQTSVDEGYPAPPLPTATMDGYPPPPTVLPTIDPYPSGESVWLIRPVGEQCADTSDTGSVELQEAVAALTAAGVPVAASEMVELMVCQACGCPTSAHFRVQINNVDLNKAIALGWIQE